MAQLKEREPQAARLELPHGEGQQGLQEQHDTLNAGGSIGLRSRVRQSLTDLVDELRQAPNPLPEIGVRAGQADADGLHGDISERAPRRQ